MGFRLTLWLNKNKISSLFHKKRHHLHAVLNETAQSLYTYTGKMLKCMWQLN